jgi:hypothetical protein
MGRLSGMPRDILHPPIDLVRRGVDEERAVVAASNELQELEGPQRVDLEVGDGIDDRGRHRDLAGHVEHDLRAVDLALELARREADVADEDFEVLGSRLLAQPRQVLDSPLPPQRVVHDHAIAGLEGVAREVGADEPGAAGDDDLSHNARSPPGNGNGVGTEAGARPLRPACGRWPRSSWS